VGAIERAQPAAAGIVYVRLGTSNTATTETTIQNTTTNGAAFTGYGSGFGHGVAGQSSTGAGISGSSNTGNGVYGATGGDSSAVLGWSYGIPAGSGIQGHSGINAIPASPANTGVFGYADQNASAAGVRGRSPSGRGGVFAGKLAQLRLQPSGAITHPSSGQLGDFFLDKNKRLWFCKGGTTWKQLA